MNYTKIFALATGALLWMSSCTSSSDLDKLPGAAVRTQQAISETVSKLEGHDGYWRLTYYPDTKRAYGGYSMYVQFKDGRVTALSELSTTSTNSTYSVKNIDMPTLAFDTRSNVLHHFITSTEYFRNARGGDFELLLMGQRGDSILLQGRKYGNQMSLQVAFRYTPEGLLFYEPITIGGVTISGFRLSSDGTSVTSIEGDVTTTVVSLPIDLVNKSYVAYFKADSAADDLVSFFTRVNNTLYRNRKARMSARTYFGVNTEADQTAGLVGNDTKVAGFLTMPIYEQTNGSYTRLSYEVDFVPVGSDPTQVDIIARDGNESTWWYWYASAAEYWVSRLATRAPYTVETLTDAAGATYYKLTSVKYADKAWFYLYEVQ